MLNGTCARSVLVLLIAIKKVHQDNRSTAQSAIVKLESGFTQGVVGFGVNAYW